jgi:MoaA/NifB/PqqE/SkfB family radical SAM enzyme
MMLTGVHFLLTYACNFECDHCFLYCGPKVGGTFTLARLREAFSQIDAIESVSSVYFEGGEPTLYQPLLLEAIRMASERKLSVGVVTNAYWATAEEDAGLWLRPLREMKIADLSVSDDAFHSSAGDRSPGKIAFASAKALGLPVGSICIESPRPVEGKPEKGEPVIGGGARIRGRAADTLLSDLPRHPASRFTECPDEDFRSPKRVHLDPCGHVQLCQGITLGNVRETPLRELFDRYDPDAHPVAGPLLRGGPSALASEHGVAVEEEGYADPCHLCYLTRKALRGRFPECIAPAQVYGEEAEEDG